MKLLSKIILLTITFFIFNTLSAQKISITLEQQQKIGALFDEWDKPDTPGVSVGVLSGDKVLFLESFGLSNLQCEQNIEPDTGFRLAGMTPHFTAFSVLLLEERNQLNLNDDIRKHLPELPEYSSPITIRHLLTHSSGLPGYWSLKALVGFQAEDVFTTQHVQNFYTNKWELTNTPGQQFIFTGTNPALLAQIVSKVSGQSFSEFIQKEIFEPLDMSNSFFVDEAHAHGEHLAQAYVDGKPNHVRHFDSGAAGFICTMNDLMKWYKNFKQPRVGSAALLRKMDALGQLENGELLSSPNGQVTWGNQFVHAERGIQKIWDYGSIGGYASSIFRFPEQELTIAVFSNTGMTYNGFLGMQIAGILLADVFEQSEDNSTTPPKFTQIAPQQSRKFTGTYYNTRSYTQREIVFRNDTLRYVRANYGDENVLLPMTENTLYMVNPYDEYVTVDLQKIDDEKHIELKIDGESYHYKKYEKHSFTKEELEGFTGSYYSGELGIVYQIFIKEGELYATHSHAGEIALSPFRQNQFIGNTSFFKLVNFTKNSQQIVSGFSLSAENMKNIYFRKIN